MSADSTDDEGLTRGSLSEEPPVPVDVPDSERRRLNVMVLLVLSAGAALLLARMLWPFITAITAALVLAVLAFPVHERVRSVIGHDRIAAFLSTAVLFFLIFLPIVGISLVLLDSLQTHADVVAEQITAFLQGEGVVRRWVLQVQERLDLGDLDLEGGLQEQIREMGGFLAGSTMGILSGLGGSLVQAGVALFTLFFLLRDGRPLLGELRRVIPLNDELTDALLNRSGEIIHATMFGSVAVGIAQGILGGIAFWALGIPGAVLWGTVMGVLGLIPVLGPPVIWFPTAVFLFGQGDVLRAAALFAAGILIVGTVDNVLRATVVGDRAQLHPLVVFFSVLGGILLFGVMGVFFGPVLFVLSISILEVTRTLLDPDGTAAES